ncbi:MAG: VanZ family protein [Deltaproteobacteria bacterium]|nr:VanZ family protein [Deltaproteobacteria bacterium]
MGSSQRRRWRFIFAFYVPLIAAIDLCAYLRLLPGWLGSIPYYDTIIHFLGLGFLGYVTHRALDRRASRLLGVALPVGPLLVGALAAADEIMQRFSTARSSNVGDLAANLSGVAVFYLVDRWLAGRPGRAGRSRETSPRPALGSGRKVRLTTGRGARRGRCSRGRRRSARFRRPGARRCRPR